MFEREAGYAVENNVLPNSIVEEFNENRKVIKSKSLMSWSEHCTECAIPFCYQTCNFYQPRVDLKCQRFPDGFTQISLSDSRLTPDFLTKISFGKWAKLEAVGSLNTYNKTIASLKEVFDQVVGLTIKYIPLPYLLKLKARRLYYSYKKRPIAIFGEKSSPEYFMLEVYNPDAVPVSLKLSIYKHESPRSRSFEDLINILPGYNKNLIPYSEIKNTLDLNSPFSIKLELMKDNSSCLYFGVLDFVTLNSSTPLINKDEAEGKKIKCLIWDLDNTLWNGVLIEDGINNLTLNSDAIKVIHESDRRGILNSVASKNNYEDAMAALKHFGLDEFFVCPQISWEPKSSAIKTIQRCLNIGIDTFAFIDDQIFEREEVASLHPSIEIFSEKNIPIILAHQRLNVPVTEDSGNRRNMYQQEIKRTENYKNSSNDYESFLRDCNIKLEINSMTEENILRAFELAQRTNQMNFSGNRYSIDELKEINLKESFIVMLISASDKFGEYGIVGLIIFDTITNRIEDLMFSCRIQAKMVDRAIICHLLSKYRGKSDLPFTIRYKESKKNKVASKIFDEMDFSILSETDSIKIFSYDNKLPLPENNIVKVTDNILDK